MSDLIVNPEEYFRYVGDMPEAWDALKGQRITHCKYGPGIIKEVKGKEGEFRVVFDKPYEGRTERWFEKTVVCINKFFTELTVPPPMSVKFAQGKAQEKVKKEYNLNPQEIKGKWQEGWTLDQHTISSQRRPDGEFGHQADTVRRNGLSTKVPLRLEPDRSYHTDSGGFSEELFFLSGVESHHSCPSF